MSSAKQPNPMVILSVSVALLGVGMAAFLTLSAPAPAPSVEVVEARPPVPRASERVEAVDADDPPPGEPTGASASDSNRAAKPAAPTPKRMARDLEREKIWRALGRKHGLEPAAPGSAAPSEEAATQLPTLKSEYVRESIREQLVPVAVDCYNTVLTSEDAAASGTLVFDFTIIGDEEVGGVVEAVALAEDSDFESEFLRECLLESLLAVTFPPPSDGGRVDVRYPMTFTPD